MGERTAFFKRTGTTVLGTAGMEEISMISREEFNTKQGEHLINESFKGSLPSFSAAFISQNKLSEDEIEEIQRLIDSYKGKEK